MSLSEFKNLEKGFLDSLSLIGDDLNKIMVVGGWCPYLYARYLWKKPIPNIPTTTDIDFGVLETGPQKFRQTLYDKLKTAGLPFERLYEDEAVPIEFIYKNKEVEMKMEFITSFQTSDDTLNRFLGSALACNRIEAFELLLGNPLMMQIKNEKKNLKIQVPKPEAFLFHKGITFVMRSDDFKRDKDLFYLYFMLKFCPDQIALLKNLEIFKNHEFFDAFQGNLTEYLSDVSKPGYLVLRPFIRRWIEEKNINSEIENIFKGIIKILL